MDPEDYEPPYWLDEELADDPQHVRLEPARRIKGLMVPIPRDRARALREFTQKWKSGESRF